MILRSIIGSMGTRATDDDPFADFPSILRWLTIIPAASMAAIIIPALFTLFSSNDGSFFSGILKVIQSGLFGYIFVLTSGYVAPKFKLQTSIVFTGLMLVLMTVMATVTFQNLKNLDLGYQLIHLVAAVVGSVIGVYAVKDVSATPIREDSDAVSDKKYWIYGLLITVLLWSLFAGGLFWLGNSLIGKDSIEYKSQSHNFSVMLPAEPTIENKDETVEGRIVKTSNYSLSMNDGREYYVSVYDYANFSDVEIDQDLALDELLERPLNATDGVTMVKSEKITVQSYPAAKATYTEEQEDSFKDLFVFVLIKDLKYYNLVGYNMSKADFEQFSNSFELTNL